MSLLKDKRIALLGGIGSRGEARDALIKELGLAELEWIYGEKNTVKAYGNFAENLTPGKYDYIFVLTKFINHKIWDALKAAKIQTPIIMVNGSYNSQNFLNAFIQQMGIKPEQPKVEEPPKPIIKKVLEPAKAHEYVPEPPTAQLESPTGDELARWRQLFNASTPEQAKARLDNKILGLETRVSKLSMNQQDNDLIKIANKYHKDVNDFLQDMPIPKSLFDSGKSLSKVLKKHKDVVGDDVFVDNRKNMSDEAMIRYAFIVSKIFRQSIKIHKRLLTDMRNSKGACIYCNRHKDVECSEACPRRVIQLFMEHLEKGSDLDIATNSKKLSSVEKLKLIII